MRVMSQNPCSASIWGSVMPQPGVFMSAECDRAAHQVLSVRVRVGRANDVSQHTVGGTELGIVVPEGRHLRTKIKGADAHALTRLHGRHNVADMRKIGSGTCRMLHHCATGAAVLTVCASLAGACAAVMPKNRASIRGGIIRIICLSSVCVTVTIA